jgi:Cu/Ag efflux protein CusF
MRKGTLIISVILTAALLFALYSLLSAYRKAIQVAVPATATVAAQVDNSQAQPTDVPTVDAMTGKITIYDAAAKAVKTLGRSDLYIVINTQFNGADAYLATFTTGDILYISQDGQILSASKVDKPAIKQPISHRGNN